MAVYQQVLDFSAPDTRRLLTALLGCELEEAPHTVVCPSSVGRR
jgi:hypothetical protein